MLNAIEKITLYKNNHSLQCNPKYMKNNMIQPGRKNVAADALSRNINQPTSGFINFICKKLILLSSSMPRSGSSFTGELLSSVPGAIYFFEPDNWLAKTCSLESCYPSLLTQIFTCSFNYSYIDFMMKKWEFFYFLNDDVKVCLNLTGRAINDCMRRFDLLAMCKAAETIVVKTIRLRLSWIERDLSKFPSHLKVIHLIRDPRPVRLSTRAFGWEKDTKKICRTMENDMDAYTMSKDNFPSRVSQINYERFCSAIRHHTRVILSFLGFVDIPKSTQMYLKNHTEYEGKHMRVLYTRANTSKIFSSWGKRISFDTLKEVENLESCHRIIDKLNLSIFESLASVRNFIEPLFRVIVAKPSLT
ncbi:carbohydrate sulfotransferase 4-like [Oratosquilla oratoria]|uniref:carbohydrate sulfotransferase 4-like n=1 Tax=Oratosquilla oratoria TaxID=337810 RepID=UPI003F776B84